MWCIPVIATLRRQSQEYQLEFRASPEYHVHAWEVGLHLLCLLHSEYETIWGFHVRPCLKSRNKTSKNLRPGDITK